MKKEFLKRAWAEISLDRLKSNVEKCRSLLSGENKLMCVVKANCYGHGVKYIVPYLKEVCDVEWFAVSNISEALELRALGINDEILILGYTPPEKAPILITHDLIQAVTEFDYAKKLADNSPEREKVRVHIAIDTGMTRIGLCGDSSADEAEKIYKMEKLSVEGIFTHLSCADSYDPDDVSFTKAQADKICALRDELVRRGISPGETHFLNSAGCAYHPDIRSTLARFGIMIYGLKPNPELPLPVDVEPIMELRAIIGQVKTVEAGTYIGYGRAFKTERETRVATAMVGYADGYPRLLSGKSEVLIHGKRARSIGRICMDQMMIDVTDIPNVCEGDIVTLFGRDGGDEITADDLAKTIGTIGYEIICGINKRVPRIIV